MPQDTLPHVAEPGSKAMTETQEKETAAQQFISNSHNAGISRKVAQQVNDPWAKT